MKTELDSAWESAIHNAERARKAEAEVERLRAELSDAYAEVHKQVAVSKVIFDRALVNRAKASLATPSEESKCKKY